jgi:hypothetical protein
MGLYDKAQDIFKPAGPSEIDKRKREAPRQRFIVTVSVDEYYRIEAIDESEAKDLVADGQAKMIDSDIMDINVQKDTD